MGYIDLVRGFTQCARIAVAGWEGVGGKLSRAGVLTRNVKLKRA